MKREEAIYCLKAQSERYSEVCEECPMYGKTGVDHCCEEALQMAITTLQNQPVWIPVSERLPEELVPVNVTWINRNPEPYYKDIKDVPFANTAVYCNGKWYWWSSTCVDYLKEYGKCDWELVDKDIDITAWMPLPEPYQGSESHKQTNADRIRNMTDEELAMAIMCPAEFTGSDKVCDFSHDCKDCTLAWLQKESEE